MHKRRVLMIEDDMDDRYITQTYFANFGSVIALTFFDGHNDVIQYLSGLDRSGLPELIVLDPGKRGYDMLKQLKSHPNYREIPVVVVCEITNAAAIKEAYSLGANSVIQKPSTLHLTKEKIETFAKYWLEVVEL